MKKTVCIRPEMQMEYAFLEIGIPYQDEDEKMFTGVTFELLRWFQILQKRESNIWEWKKYRI